MVQLLQIVGEIMSNNYTISDIKQKIKKIAIEYGIERIYLFGSFARGDNLPSSDLDFRIDRGKVKGLLQLGALYSDLEETFNMPVDVVTTDSLEPAFLDNIKKEEVLIYDSH